MRGKGSYRSSYCIRENYSSVVFCAFGGWRSGITIRGGGMIRWKSQKECWRALHCKPRTYRADKILSLWSTAERRSVTPIFKEQDFLRQTDIGKGDKATGTQQSAKTPEGLKRMHASVHSQTKRNDWFALWIVVSRFDSLGRAPKLQQCDTNDRLRILWLVSRRDAGR